MKIEQLLSFLGGGVDSETARKLYESAKIHILDLAGVSVGSTEITVMAQSFGYAHFLNLPTGPIKTITSITRLGTTTAVSSSAYIIPPMSYAVFRPSGSWTPGIYTVIYTPFYSEIPEDLDHATAMLVSRLYDARGANNISAGGVSQTWPEFYASDIMSLVNQYNTGTV